MKGPKPGLKNVVPFKGDAVSRVPDAPDWLSERARVVWDELAGHLFSKNRLDPSYQHLFAAYCESVANFYNATSVLAVEGYYYETQTRNGRQQKKTAMWGVQQESLAAMARLGALFGLSPVDEARLHVGGQGDFMAALMAQMKNAPD